MVILLFETLVLRSQNGMRQSYLPLETNSLLTHALLHASGIRNESSVKVTSYNSSKKFDAIQQS